MELNRRIETVTQSLELLARQNIELKLRIPPEERNRLRFSGVQEDIGTVQLLQAKIDELEMKANRLNNELVSEQQKELSSQLSIKTYDRYINKLLTQQMKENMKKEAMRRKAVEFHVRRLTQKVDELEFLVGEKEGNSSDNTDETDELLSSDDSDDTQNKKSKDTNPETTETDKKNEE